MSRKKVCPRHVGSLSSWDSREVFSSWLSLGVLSATVVSYTDSGTVLICLIIELCLLCKNKTMNLCVCSWRGWCSSWYDLIVESM